MNRNTSTKKQADKFILADNNFNNVMFIQECEQASVDDEMQMMLKMTMEDLLTLTNKTRTPTITLMLIMSETSLKSYLNPNILIEYNVKKSTKNICNTELFY